MLTIELHYLYIVDKKKAEEVKAKLTYSISLIGKRP